MTNSTQHTAEDNRTIVLIANGQRITLDLRQVLLPELRDQLRAHCESVQQITIMDWQNIVSSPIEVSLFFLELIRNSEAVWTFNIRGHQSCYDNPFDAILNTTINRADLTAVGQATSLAIAAAAMQCPAASQEAGIRIHQWLSNNGVQGETPRSLATQIRRSSSVQADNSRMSPQDAAHRVLAHLQAEREANGEQYISSPPVRYYLDDFYVWNGRHWALCPNFELRIVQILLATAESNDLTSSFIQSVVMNLKGVTHLDAHGARPPLFIVNEESQQVQEQQAFGMENGIIDTAILQSADSQIQLYAPNPALFAEPRLNYHYIPAASCALWLQTLTEILAPTSPSDHRIDALQEFFGYCLLSANHRFETFLILIGEGSNGKSVILEVLTAMLGKHNVSHVSLDALGSEFRNAEMIGKLANIATDMQRMPRVHEGILKQLVSGEPIQINRKHKPAVTMYPTAKLIFATNHLPPFSDTSDGLWRRMLVIPFFTQFTGDRIDRRRAERIVAEELSGVLNWAIEGARRLARNDSFTHCAVCTAAKGGHRHDSDPFLQFLDECCEFGEELTVLVDELYTAYRGFCEHGGKMPKAKSEFGKQVAKFAVVSRERVGPASRRYYIYRGIGVLPTVLVSQVLDSRSRRYQPPHRQEH